MCDRLLKFRTDVQPEYSDIIHEAAGRILAEGSSRQPFMRIRDIRDDDVTVTADGNGCTEISVIIRDELYVARPYLISRALEKELESWAGRPVKVSFVPRTLRVVLLGPVRNPYTTWQDGTPKCYVIRETAGDSMSGYQVGDSFRQGSSLVVYGVSAFYDETEAAEWLNEKYPDLREI